MTRSTTLLFSTVAAAALVAACGGAAREAQGPEGAPVPSATAAAGADGGAPATMAGADGGAAGAMPSTDTAAAFSGPMKPVAASAMLADVQAIGLDPKNLPPLTKMEPDKLRKVMRSFSKSLGAKCTDCHVESDYAAATPMKKIAAGMWDHYVREMAMSDGAPVFCDSCHQGRRKTLDRHDKKALGKWMDDNFVGKMKRKDGKEHSCSTCHGDPFDPVILGKWAGTAK